VHAVVLLAVLKMTLKLELGPEYDSNANRSEVVAGVVNPDPPIGSFLVRTTARAALQWKRGINLLRVQAGLGAKVFFNPDVLDQSVLVVQGGLEDRVSLGRHAALTIGGDYYDAFQDLIAPTCNDCLRRRDFRTGTAAAKLALFDGPGSFWFGAGYRGFGFKPDEYFNFQAPTADAGASLSLLLGKEDEPHELTLGATYHVERRGYNGLRQVESNVRDFSDPNHPIDCAPDKPLVDGCLITGSDQRVDWWHEANTELAYVGVLLAALSYGVQLNRSNSFGQSLLRHIVTLRLGYRLPWQLYATVKGQLMVSAGLDKVRLDPRVSNLTFATIEDENRNAVIVDLERNLPRLGLAVNARYSFFANELGTQQTSFRRHVGYLGLTYRFSTR
jgi:hypothetical protein